MKLSSANMSAEDLLAALALARCWGMKTLENNYAHVLSRRISNTTLISVRAIIYEKTYLLSEINILATYFFVGFRFLRWVWKFFALHASNTVY